MTRKFDPIVPADDYLYTLEDCVLQGTKGGIAGNAAPNSTGIGLVASDASRR